MPQTKWHINVGDCKRLLPSSKMFKHDRREQDDHKQEKLVAKKRAAQ